MQQIDTIPLSDNEAQLLWLNRNEQQTVFSTSKRASNGAFHFFPAQVSSGLPLLIGTGASGLSRATFAALQAHANNTLGQFDIDLGGGETFTVVWDTTSGPAVTGKDLFDEVGGHALVTEVQLKFFTV